MDVRAQLPGLATLQAETLGDPRLCIAVLDGPVSLSHPCFADADLRVLPTVAGSAVGAGAMSLHGTHVTSLVFGQLDSPVVGIAPRCRGLIVPIFRDAQNEKASQLDLARAIEQALDEGADVISVSGGERSPTGEAQSMLERALRRSADAGVLVVAAVGNDGCDCLQVPAAAPSVLAVGACDAQGQPLLSNNWGEIFQTNGVLAPGHQLDGATPDGGRQALTGSSFATPVVAATAALLLSTRLAAAAPARPIEAGSAILASAIPCPTPDDDMGCRRHLRGRLDVGRARELITQKGDPAVNDPLEAVPTPPPAHHSGPAATRLAGHDHQATGVAAAASPPPDTPGSPPEQGMASPEQTGSAPPAPPWASPVEEAHAHPSTPAAATAPVAATLHSAASSPSPPAPHSPAPVAQPAVRAAAAGCGCGASGGLVYAIGVIGYDFGTEARRDGFRQQMDRPVVPPPPGEAAPPDTGYIAPPNPYDPHQLSSYLAQNPWASDKLIWTLNLDRTPIYALEAETPVGMTWDGFHPSQGDTLHEDVAHPDQLASIMESFAANPPVSYVYKQFRDAIVGQVLKITDPNFVSRVSIPGILTNRTVRLFSGQIVPVVEVKARGLYTWNERALVNSAVAEVKNHLKRSEPELDDRELSRLEKNVRALLDKIYYEFRNLGQSSPDRAMNYAGTNAFAITGDIYGGLTSGMAQVAGAENDLYTLDAVTVSKSPYCRMDSDCWDVVVTFFNPVNDRQASISYLYTIDVSDALPVSLAPSHQFLTR